MSLYITTSKAMHIEELMTCVSPEFLRADVSVYEINETALKHILEVAEPLAVGMTIIMFSDGSKRSLTRICCNEKISPVPEDIILFYDASTQRWLQLFFDFVEAVDQKTMESWYQDDQDDFYESLSDEDLEDLGSGGSPL